MAHQEPEAALMSYARAVSLRPDDVEIRFDRGILLNQLGRHREALGELDLVLASDPDKVQRSRSAASPWSRSTATRRRRSASPAPSRCARAMLPRSTATASRSKGSAVPPRR